MYKGFSDPSFGGSFRSLQNRPSDFMTSLRMSMHVRTCMCGVRWRSRSSLVGAKRVERLEWFDKFDSGDGIAHPKQSCITPTQMSTHVRQLHSYRSLATNTYIHTIIIHIIRTIVYVRTYLNCELGTHVRMRECVHIMVGPGGNTIPRCQSNSAQLPQWERGSWPNTTEKKNCHLIGGYWGISYHIIP